MPSGSFALDMRIFSIRIDRDRRALQPYPLFLGRQVRPKEWARCRRRAEGRRLPLGRLTQAHWHISLISPILVITLLHVQLTAQELRNLFLLCCAHCWCFRLHCHGLASKFISKLKRLRLSPLAQIYNVFWSFLRALPFG